MSTYCLSDPHGERDRFHAVLKAAAFGKHDRLFILGDVIDRGPESIELLQDVLALPGAVLLRGNHEQMMLEALAPESPPTALTKWANNGGEQTLCRFLTLSPGRRKELLKSLGALPDAFNLRVADKTFHLVHGMPSDDSYLRLWGRVEAGADCRLPGQDAVVFGHTPTWLYSAQLLDGHCRIWRGAGVIGIDCGCGHLQFPRRRLACLRLEDMEEFYA
ncbi:Bis(5'-nucleosyl)-tetraphosphatase, symmetrical [bioreactor metagenome]|uniref:Bis(5'-nucleosyl)-tetraphosphatase, symmetrical n=1 Tax=bioreactor metagenome TaxID=1076179 RepID=A0A644X1W3_9ZZZZ